jgi:hypothetical protein
LLEKADQALYRAKRSGRDCVKQDAGVRVVQGQASEIQAAMQ